MATFEGRVDGATGALTLTTSLSPAASPALPQALSAPFAPWSDGSPGTGPENTFELRTGTVTGNGTACPGGAASWEGEVILTSFFDTQAFTDVTVELTSLSPAGHEACNGDPASGGTSDAFGLWDYGALTVAGTPGATATRTWRFARPDSQGFTFHGRILATLAPLAAPANGATSFEWAPYLFADPPRSFQHQGTTLSHVVWDGSGFTDLVGPLSFAPVGAAAQNHVVGITYPPQEWAGPFASGASYQAIDTIGLTGDFTVCVKFKPGTDPAVGDRKVLVAKGSPVDSAGFGWALSQQHGETQQYAIWYDAPGQTGSYDTFNHPNSAHPEAWAFDYLCGGRDGTNVREVNHGREIRFALAVGGNPLPGGLPLVIGAQADGNWPAVDAGIYEIIFDSRPATLATMAEIVSRAEGRRVYDGVAFWGSDAEMTAVVGADGATYQLPFGATLPVSSDGSGLLDAGTVLPVGIPGATPTLLAGSPASWCVGAEVASSDWASATGCVLGDVNGALKIWFLGSNIAAVTGNQYRALGPDVSGWAANSRHTFLVCTPGSSANTAALHVDGVLAGQSDASGSPFDVTNGSFIIGSCGFGGGALSGARIGRVFACPTNVAASCN